MPVHIDNRHPTLRINQQALAKHLRQSLAKLGHPRATVDVSLVDDREIRGLNAQYRGVDAPTDVLSFAMHEETELQTPVDLLGDIVVALDTAQRQAKALQLQADAPDYSLAHETAFLATHGLLHLLGYDHQDGADAARMEALERQLMQPLTTIDVHSLDRSDHGL